MKVLIFTHSGMYSCLRAGILVDACKRRPHLSHVAHCLLFFSAYSIQACFRRSIGFMKTAIVGSQQILAVLFNHIYTYIAFPSLCQSACLKSCGVLGKCSSENMSTATCTGDLCPDVGQP